VNGSEARAKVQELIARCDDLREGIAEAEHKSRTIAAHTPDDPEAIAWADRAGRLKTELNQVTNELAETRALAVRLLCADRYQAQLDKAKAANVEAHGAVTQALERQRVLLQDPMRTLAQEREVKEEIHRLSQIADRTARALTRASERYGRWVTWASTQDGLRWLGLL
jgi:hypothetical protein